MNNYVLYRKWRPKSFSELVGQTAIRKTLENAIYQNRIAHAYLFSGPRGTGKTSTARILAKAINCKTKNIEDRLICNTCENCIDINSSNSLDLIEIDAASNRGIDEIRSIKDKSNYSPSKSMYKVYVLDEAHMLTKDASNALLKTLEEPPPHVVFILATTEPDKMEPTILSRCQRFDFKKIDTTDTVQRLEQIANDEKVNISEPAIKRIAEISEGSLRDAESFLEQIILSNDEEYIDINQINTILGITDIKQIELLQEAILTGDINQTIQLINNSVSNNTSIKQLHNSLILSFRESLIKLANTSNSKDQILHIAKCLKIFVNLDFSKSLNHASSIEIAAIEASMLRENENYISPELNIKEPIEYKTEIISTENIEKSMDIAIETIDPDTEDSNVSNTDPEIEKQEEIEIKSEQNREIVSENIIKSESWQLVIEKFAKIKGERFAIGALLRDCREASINNNNLYLSFASNSNQERFVGELEHGKIKLDLIESISQIFQIPRINEIVYNDEGKKSNSNNNSVNLSVMKALNWGGKIIEEEVKNDE
ncbi:MAG: DNA polymerase III subunit gamma/tau [Dehalococcoidia bacterium]